MSLIEILATLIIIAMLCSISVYSYREYKTKVLYNNSINVMEQHKAIIYTYFSQYKTCPPNNTINKSLSSNYIGNKIINNNCDLVLCQNSTEILSFDAITGSEILSELSGGIQYNCRFTLPAGETDTITKYLPQCTANSVATASGATLATPTSRC